MVSEMNCSTGHLLTFGPDDLYGLMMNSMRGLKTRIDCVLCHEPVILELKIDAVMQAIWRIQSEEAQQMEQLAEEREKRPW